MADGRTRRDAKGRPVTALNITSHPDAGTDLVYSIPITHQGRAARFFLATDGHVEVWTLDGQYVPGEAERLTERARLQLLGWLANPPGGFVP